MVEIVTGEIKALAEPCSSTSSSGLRGSDFIRRLEGLLLPEAVPLFVGCDSSGLCELSLKASFDAFVLGDSSLWTGREVVLSGFDSAGTWHRSVPGPWTYTTDQRQVSLGLCRGLILPETAKE